MNDLRLECGSYGYKSPVKKDGIYDDNMSEGAFESMKKSLSWC